MFERFLRFFVDNARMNYTLFVLIFAIGIWAYNNTAKEIFPTFELEMISVTGSYSGASVDILDKMAVREIEDDLKNLDSINLISTVISPGRFSIIIELKDGKDRFVEQDKVKDIIALVQNDLPSDMDEPTVRTVDRARTLLDISLTSKIYSLNELKPLASDIKSELMGIEGINDITIFGDSDRFYEISIDEKKVEALGLNKTNLFNAISSLSYIFPIGKIEGDEKHFFLSTFNGAKTAQDFANTIIKIDNSKIYLRDVASVRKTYEDSSTLYSFNGKNALSLKVEQNDEADALKITKEIKKLLPELNAQNKDVEVIIADDNSERIQDRLNIVVSNIMLGIILITLLVMFLINSRMALIIFIGIPTSFVIASVYIYFSGYSINMITLVGVLLAIGIVVDDAIVVSENIQQHIEEGYPPKEAAVLGAKEMFKPVTVASFTTLFSFLPILLISGTLGEVIKLIPIALSSLVIASLIESFIFLPIHAAHILKSDSKVTSWEKANTVYNSILNFFMHWKKSFLIIFIILVPVLTYLLVSNSKFQMFPKFDASDVRITIKANENTKLEDSFKIVQAIEEDFLNKKDEFFIRSIDSVAGFRQDGAGNTERFPYVMYITLELQKMKEMNIIDKYITPNLSFYYDGEGRTRELKSSEIARAVKRYLEDQDYKTKFDLEEIGVVERRVGPVKTDIEIGLVSNSTEKILASVDKLQKEIGAIEGIKDVFNSVKFGVDEIKIKINPYGQSLGLDEATVGNFLSNLYLLKKKSVAFDDTSMLDIKVESLNKDDFENLKNVKMPLSDGTFVRLEEVSEFVIIRGFEQLIKEDGLTNFYIFANVDPDIITANEVLEKIDSSLKEIENDGLQVILRGEAEKQKTLRNDMLYATGLAFVLILLAMLYLFNSFKDTFITMSIIPFSILGVLIGHEIMGLNLSMPSVIGILGLAGVVINDGIIMMTNLKKAKSDDEIFLMATKRFRPIIITTVTTLIGMSSLIFFPTGQAVIFQPIAIGLGFGLLWGTILNLIYLPVLYTLTHRLKNKIRKK